MRTSAKRAAAGAVASIIGALAVSVVAASPAQAICRGVGDGVTISTEHNGILVAQERQRSGTCDGDGIYNGQLRDPATDGYAALAVYEDGSFNGVMAIARSNTWVNYTFYDQTGNEYTLLDVYASPASKWASQAGSWGY